MKILSLWLFITFLSSPDSAFAVSYLELIKKIPHSGYSEGLDFHQGYLWNAFPKHISKIDPKDGTVIAKYQPATAYSESIKWVKGVLWNVSFTDNGIYKGGLSDNQLSFKQVGLTPETHAWGLEYDGTHLIVTGNYSDKIYFLNPETLTVARFITVPIKDIEDLAWDGEGLWASSFTQHRGRIFRIDPNTGATSELYILPDAESCPVVDGIAYDGKSLWITGKECPSLFNVKLPVLRGIAGSPANKKAPAPKR